MRFIRFFSVELKRIFRSKLTWMAMALTLLSPLMGFSWFPMVPTVTMASSLIANPVMMGAVVGTILFAVLTLYEMNRVHRSETDALTETIVSPLTLDVARTLSLFGPAIVSVIAAMVIYLPYVSSQMGNIFEISLYVSSFLLIMLPSMIFGIIVSSSIYCVTRRMDISLLLFVIFVVLSSGNWVSDDFILRWVTPLVPVFSDDFSNVRVMRMIAYNRLVWSLVLTGTFLLSVLCIRRYGRGLLKSLIQNGRRFYVPILAVVMITTGAYAYVGQPFIDHSPPDLIYEDSVEYNEMLALNGTHVDAILDTKRGRIQATATYDVKNESGEPQMCSATINPGYKVKSIMINGVYVDFEDLNNDINNEKTVKFEVPSDKDLKIIIEYGGFPQEWTLSKSMLMGSDISDDYVSLKSSSLSPFLAMLVTGYDIEFTGRITMPEHLTMVATGKTTEEIAHNTEDKTKTWLISEKGVSASLFAADYVMHKIDAGGLDIEFYYSRKHEQAMQGMKAEEVMKEVIDYCTEKFGPLPYSTGLPLKLIQSTAYMMGGQAYRNFSVMGETYFSDENLNDPQKGADSMQVLAHEIIHQWWGLSAMLMDEIPWTSEGITVYTNYWLMKEKFGDQYVEENYVDQWKKSLDLLNRSFYRRHPEYLEILPEKYRYTVKAQEDSTLMYDVMPLQFLKAEEILGTKRLEEVLTQLYRDGGTEMPPYLTYNDFLNASGLTREEISVE